MTNLKRFPEESLLRTLTLIFLLFQPWTLLLQLWQQNQLLSLAHLILLPHAQEIFLNFHYLIKLLCNQLKKQTGNCWKFHHIQHCLGSKTLCCGIFIITPLYHQVH
jgi:hypothetical protein